MRLTRATGPRVGTGDTSVRFASDEFASGSGATQVALAPVVLPPNPVFRFYRGGPGIDAFRGVEPGTGANAPEDWVASTTTVFRNPAVGLAALADGRLLRDVIAADPIGYLGSEHVARLGANPGVLVKLLDAGERLSVHFHPGREFARAHLNSQFGKTEAWLILAAEPGAEMHLGLREQIDINVLERWVGEQDSAVMLEALHKVPVVTGDVLFVPAGTLHTIGEGITLIELQEPSDMSVVLEWQRAGVSNGDERLQLDWDLVLTAADTHPTAPAHATPAPAAPGSSTIEHLLPAAADPFFQAERVSVGGPDLQIDPGFAVLIGTEGELTLSTERHEPLQITRGTAVLVPFGAGVTRLSGRGAAIRCLPPVIDANREPS
jgi:mannose-6-phosphate isomerase